MLAQTRVLTKCESDGAKARRPRASAAYHLHTAPNVAFPLILVFPSYGDLDKTHSPQPDGGRACVRLRLPAVVHKGQPCSEASALCSLLLLPHTAARHTAVCGVCVCVRVRARLCEGQGRNARASVLCLAVREKRAERENGLGKASTVTHRPSATARALTYHAISLKPRQQ